MVVYDMIKDGFLGRHIPTIRTLYGQQCQAMLAAMDEFFPAAAQWTRPEGGMFIWVTLPDYINTTDLLARALAENVAFVPGEAAFADGRGRSSMRLNFSSSTEEEIREGVRRIGKIVAQQVALYGTLTGHRTTSAAPPAARDAGAGPLADILELPRRGAVEGRRSRGA